MPRSAPPPSVSLMISAGARAPTPMSAHAGEHIRDRSDREIDEPVAARAGSRSREALGRRAGCESALVSLNRLLANPPKMASLSEGAFARRPAVYASHARSWISCPARPGLSAMAFSDQRAAAFEHASDTTKQLIRLATAIIAVSITFSKDIIGNTTAHRGVLISAWITYLLSIIFGVWALLAMTGELQPSSQSTEDPSIRRPNVTIPPWSRS
jgi:hypothetical protein